MNKNNLRKNFILLFLLIELVLYITFLYQDLSQQGSILISMNLKYIGIIICFLFSLLFYPWKNATLDCMLLRCALLFTVISDWYIVMRDSYFYGLITFCIVQLLYLIRLHCWRKEQGIRTFLISYILRNILFTLIITGVLIFFKITLDELVFTAIFYFVSIIFNTMDAIRIQLKEKEKSYQLYAVGMVLFLLCDINVGLFNLSDFMVVEGTWFNKIYEFAAIAMWLFYLPAQVVISLSGVKNKLQ